MVNPTPLPSNVPHPAQAPSSSAPLTTISAQNSGGTEGVPIKAEPTSYDSSGVSQTSGVPMYGSPIALQRAAQNLQQKFGSNASLQINQLQGQTGMAAPAPQQAQGLQNSLQNIQLPPVVSEQQRRDFATNHTRQLQSRPYQTLQQAQQRPGVTSGQTDGADDWDAMVTQRRAEAPRDPTDRYNATLTLKQQIDASIHALEGGGLMLPLSERPKPPEARMRKVTPQEAGNSSSASSVVARFAEAPEVARYDGLDDESDEDNIKDDPGLLDDEDAINSDLDDPDDNVVEEADEETQRGQIMLCTYDKVQRVKNKWKCTLKDGVLTTGGKE